MYVHGAVRMNVCMHTHTHRRIRYKYTNFHLAKHVLHMCKFGVPQVHYVCTHVCVHRRKHTQIFTLPSMSFICASLMGTKGNWSLSSWLRCSDLFTIVMLLMLRGATGVCVCVCQCVCIIYVCVCIYIYIYIYKHTHVSIDEYACHRKSALELLPVVTLVLLYVCIRMHVYIHG
jgi:hypothetical protein